MLRRVGGVVSPGDSQQRRASQGKLALELKQQPAVTEKEVVSTSFLQVLVEVRVCVSQQQLEVSKLWWPWHDHQGGSSQPGVMMPQKQTKAWPPWSMTARITGQSLMPWQ